jgi:hypothetical protein
MYVFGEEGITEGTSIALSPFAEKMQTFFFLEDSVPPRCRIFFAALALK